jgi:hypothetical protein
MSSPLIIIFDLQIHESISRVVLFETCSEELLLVRQLRVENHKESIQISTLGANMNHATMTITSSVPFERCIEVLNLYDDDVKVMVLEMPRLLVQRALALGLTPKTTNFNDLSAAAFVVGSNKHEGTFTPNKSEEDVFKLFVSHVQRSKLESVSHAVPW